MLRISHGGIDIPDNEILLFYFHTAIYTLGSLLC